MIFALVIALISGLVIAWLAARVLFRISMRKNRLNSTKDKLINGVITALIFFCSSSFIYVLLLSIMI